MEQAPKTPGWEPVAIILSIVAILPKIWAFVQRKEWPVADVLMYVALAAMAVVFIRKVQRLRALWKHQERG